MVRVKFSSKIDRWFAKQVGFAARLTVTESADHAIPVINDELADTFTLRGRWTARGTRRVKATRGRNHADVGTTREYLEDHLTGAVRGGGRSTVPFDVRRKFATRISQRRWAGRMRGERFFAAAGRKANTRLLVYRRATRSKGRRRKQRPPKLMWAVVDRQKVGRRWNFISRVEQVHRRIVEAEFPRFLERAFRTARPPK